MADKLLKIILLLIFFITLAHFISLHFYLYWQFWWLDILMHFLGGVWVFSFAVWIMLFSGIWKNSGDKTSLIFLLALISTLAVAVGWEIYEFKLGITFVTSDNYWQDTISDILVSFAGALATFIFFRRFMLTKVNLKLN